MHRDGDDNLAVMCPASSAPRPNASLDPLPLGAPVLEPDFHLKHKCSDPLLCLVIPTPLTWTSESLRLWAIWLRSERLRYFLLWNSFSSSSSCSLVKAVLRLLVLPGPQPPASRAQPPSMSSRPPSSSSSVLHRDSLSSGISEDTLYICRSWVGWDITSTAKQVLGNCERKNII